MGLRHYSDTLLTLEQECGLTNTIKWLLKRFKVFESFCGTIYFEQSQFCTVTSDGKLTPPGNMASSRRNWWKLDLPKGQGICMQVLNLGWHHLPINYRPLIYGHFLSIFLKLWSRPVIYKNNPWRLLGYATTAWHVLHWKMTSFCLNYAKCIFCVQFKTATENDRVPWLIWGGLYYTFSSLIF